MRWTGFVGDSVWAADPFLKRITLYGPDLQLVRTKSIPKLSLPRGQQPQLPKTNGVYPFALFSDGSMLMQAFSYSNYLNQPTEGPLGVPVYRVSDAGVVQRKVGWIPVTRDIAGSVNRPQNWIQAHFANIPQHAVSADGAFFVTIIADVSDSSSLKAQVTLVRASGDTAYSRSIPVDAPRIPDSVMVKARRQQATDSKERQAVFKKIKLPEFYAPLHKAAVSTTGQVVIAFTSEAEHNNLNVRFRGAALREYLLLNADGSPRGVFVLPHRTELLQLDSDALWVTEYDEDDVPSIVRYRWS